MYWGCKWLAGLLMWSGQAVLSIMTKHIVLNTCHEQHKLKSMFNSTMKHFSRKNHYWVGMLTRLEKISRYRALNFSLSRSAINSWTDDQRLFNDGRYANPPAGGLCVSWEWVNQVGSLDGNYFPMGEGEGRSTGPPATREVSVGRPSEGGVIQQRAHTLNLPPYQHCICN